MEFRQSGLVSTPCFLISIIKGNISGRGGSGKRGKRKDGRDCFYRLTPSRWKTGKRKGEGRGRGSIFKLWGRENLATLDSESALVFRSGFNTSHLIPIFQGKCSHKQIMRIDVGGNTSTSYLQQILQLSHPNIKMTYPLANQIKGNLFFGRVNFSGEFNV
jgi:actin-related protein